eukprot:6195451-Pleurochrysis_carterae.AAC.2
MTSLSSCQRVLTVAAPKLRRQERKRGKGYREFNVSARNDGPKGEILAVRESSTAAFSDQVVEAITFRLETRLQRNTTFCAAAPAAGAEDPR